MYGNNGFIKILIVLINREKLLPLGHVKRDLITRMRIRYQVVSSKYVLIWTVQTRKPRNLHLLLRFTPDITNFEEALGL